MKLRLPSALKQKLEEAATRNNRSLNAEIVKRMEESFDAEVPDFVTPEVIEAIFEIREKLNDLHRKGSGQAKAASKRTA